MLCTNLWTFFAINIDQNNLRVLLCHQVFKLRLDGLAHAALRSPEEQKNCLSRF